MDKLAQLLFIMYLYGENIEALDDLLEFDCKYQHLSMLIDSAKQDNLLYNTVVGVVVHSPERPPIGVDMEMSDRDVSYKALLPTITIEILLDNNAIYYDLEVEDYYIDKFFKAAQKLL